jgi:hypothetical protein
MMLKQKGMNCFIKFYPSDNKLRATSSKVPRTIFMHSPRSNYFSRSECHTAVEELILEAWRRIDCLLLLLLLLLPIVKMMTIVMIFSRAARKSKYDTTTTNNIINNDKTSGRERNKINSFKLKHLTVHSVRHQLQLFLLISREQLKELNRIPPSLVASFFSLLNYRYLYNEEEKNEMIIGQLQCVVAAHTFLLSIIYVLENYEGMKRRRDGLNMFLEPLSGFGSLLSYTRIRTGTRQ